MNRSVRRFDKKGRTVDMVVPTVNRLGDFIYLTLCGEKGVLSFEFPLSEWSRIVESKDPKHLRMLPSIEIDEAG